MHGFGRFFEAGSPAALALPRGGLLRGAEVGVVSLDADGHLRWSAQTLAAGAASDIGMYNPAVSAEDVIYVGGDKLYAFTKDGSPAWSYGQGLRVTNAPFLDAQGNLYFSTGSVSGGAARVVCLDSSGRERWVFTAPGSLETYSSPAFSADSSRVYVGLGQAVYCLSASDGAVEWVFSPGGHSGQFRATPAVDPEGNVYVGTKGSESSVLYAIKADGSGALWENAIGADLYSSPALGSDRTLYVGSEFRPGNLRLHAIDMATGEIRWQAPLPADPTWSSPALADDGTLFIATMGSEEGEGALVSFDTDSSGLLPGAGSARFHLGNASTGRR